MLRTWSNQPRCSRRNARTARRHRHPLPSRRRSSIKRQAHDGCSGRIGSWRSCRRSRWSAYWNGQRGDIVGIGIHTGNALRGMEVGRVARERGALVVYGGIHATLYPDEAFELGGAHAVVKGDGDVVWARVISDLSQGRAQAIYDGSRVSGERFLSARWDLLPERRYMWASVQTVRGCPKHCSFCSVWRTDGQEPRTARCRSCRARRDRRVAPSRVPVHRAGRRQFLSGDPSRISRQARRRAGSRAAQRIERATPPGAVRAHGTAG